MGGGGAQFNSTQTGEDNWVFTTRGRGGAGIFWVQMKEFPLPVGSSDQLQVSNWSFHQADLIKDGRLGLWVGWGWG